MRHTPARRTSATFLRLGSSVDLGRVALIEVPAGFRVEQPLGCPLWQTRKRPLLAESTYIGLDSTVYGTHTMRRTKATLIYKRTKNLRAVQLLLGHSKLESTVRYLGIEVDDALEISEQTEI